MVISMTPVRISFFGGGTDYPQWLKNNDGAVISATIDKYIYISCRYFPPFFEYSINLNYSKIERCNSIGRIEHPAIRECLRFMKIGSNIEINHSSDLPGKSGLGSSSAFVVGLLYALHAYKGRRVSKRELAEKAINVEHNWIRENVGYQDQYAASLGGLNLIKFNKNRKAQIHPVIIPPGRVNLLQKHLLLFHTGITRVASDVVAEQLNNIPKSTSALCKMHDMVYSAADILGSGKKITGFGELLHEGWMFKKTLSSRISNERIDLLYKKGRAAGAIGGKLLGAGGGGFLLLFAEPSRHRRIRNALGDLIFVPFNFENAGSRIIYSSP